MSQFQELYKKHFGEELIESDARGQLIRLVRLMEAVYQPITQGQFKAYIKEQVDGEGGNE